LAACPGTQRNREIFSKNREFRRKYRELYWPKSKSSPDEVFELQRGA
jgi:hypothetical protein